MTVSPAVSRRSLHAVFALALAVRALMLWAGYDRPFLAGMTQGNEAMNWALGRGLVFTHYDQSIEPPAEGRPLDPEVYRNWTVVRTEPYLRYHMPGQAAVLALFFRVTDRMTLAWWQIFCGVLDAFGVYLLFFMGARFFSEPVALWSSVLYAIRLPFAVISTSLLREAPLTFLGLLAGFFFFRFWDSRRAGWAVAAGAVCGAATYFRAEFLTLAVFFILVGIVVPVKDVPVRRRLSTLGVLLGALIVLAPWIRFNQKEFGKTVLTQQLKWPSLWSALGEIPNDFNAVNRDHAVHQLARESGVTAPYYSFEFDAFYKEKVEWVLKNRPIWMLKLFLHRAVKIPMLRNYWGSTSTESEAASFKHGGLSVFAYAAKFPVQFFIKAFGAVENLTLHLLAAVGAFLLWKVGVWRDREGLFIWFVPFIYNYLIHVATGVDSRYMLWSSPYLLPPAITAVLIWRRR